MKQLPKEILIASNNQGKIKEISQLLSDLDIKAIAPKSLDCFKDMQEPEETGQTFEENSLIKAKFYADKSGIASLADDSGFCIDDLNNEPGIHSARSATDESGKKNFKNAFAKIFDRLSKLGKNPEKNQIKAHFICNLSIFDPKTDFSESFEGRIDGHLSTAKGENGFGYDPIFIKENMSQTFAQIDPELKNDISHRAAAFKILTNWLKKIQQS